MNWNEIESQFGPAASFLDSTPFFTPVMKENLLTAPSTAQTEPTNGGINPVMDDGRRLSEWNASVVPMQPDWRSLILPALALYGLYRFIKWKK